MAQKVISYDTAKLDAALTSIRSELAGTPELAPFESVVTLMETYISKARSCESFLIELYEIEKGGKPIKALLGGFIDLRKILS